MTKYKGFYGPGLDALGHAIMIQSIIDAQGYPRRIEHLKHMKGVGKLWRKRRIAELKKEYQDLLGFFDSQWCYALSGKNREEILNKIEGKDIAGICRGWDRSI